jgi:DNA-binding beta-propeller fold protein YncE
MPGNGNVQLQLPEALVQDPDGRWLVVDEQRGRVGVVDALGNLIRQIGSPVQAPGQLYYPCGIALGPDHLVYVAENQTHRVSVFGLAGNFVRTIGTSGSGKLQFPVGVSTDTANLYVADYGNHRIAKFLLDGTFVASLTGGVSISPYGVRVGPDGNLWASDIGGNRVLKMSPTGVALGIWSGAGDPDGQFYAPENVSFDASGNSYMMDTGNNRVQVFDTVMNFICRFGSTGAGLDQFRVPTDAAFDAAGRMFITDYGNHRVSVWGFEATDVAPHTPLAFALASVGPTPVVAWYGSRSRWRTTRRSRSTCSACWAARWPQPRRARGPPERSRSPGTGGRTTGGPRPRACMSSDTRTPAGRTGGESFTSVDLRSGGKPWDPRGTTGCHPVMAPDGLAARPSQCRRSRAEIATAWW